MPTGLSIGFRMANPRVPKQLDERGWGIRAQWIPGNRSRAWFNVTPEPSGFIPSNNEWYKAAYYKGGSTTQDTGSTQPNMMSPLTQSLPADIPSLAGSANYSEQLAARILTDVGAGRRSPGPYGTSTRPGNVGEWTDSYYPQYENTREMLRDTYCWWSRGATQGNVPSDYIGNFRELAFGFRVATISLQNPPPSLSSASVPSAYLATAGGGEGSCTTCVQ